MISKVSKNVSYLGVRHGRIEECIALRRFLDKQVVEGILIDLPPEIGSELSDMVHLLPEIHGLVFRNQMGEYFWASNDPCEVYIEAIRQSQMRRIPIYWMGEGTLVHPRASAVTWDPILLEAVGNGNWEHAALDECIEMEVAPLGLQNVFANMEDFLQSEIPLLVLGPPEGLVYYKYWLNGGERPEPEEDPGLHSFEILPLHPQNLYFSLGELPAITAWVEQDRRDPFANEKKWEDHFKRLLILTRREYLKKGEALAQIGHQRLQKILDFTWRLARINGRIRPELIDAAEACKGVLGDRFTRQFLKAAKDYPYFDPVKDQQWLKVGADSLKHPLNGQVDAEFLFRDPFTHYESINLKREIPKDQAETMRKEWNTFKSCSHVPEDIAIEGFNKRARQVVLSQIDESQAKCHPFLTDLGDGIDLRETLRHWGQGQIYVKETPRSKFKADTVVLIFDDQNDEKYPNQMVWFAEHKNESTLCFYATEALEKMKGPGIAELTYGGLSLLFPPRPTPNPFDQRLETKGFNLSEKLIWGGLINTAESHLIVCSAQKPSLKIEAVAKLYGKILVHLPFSQFGDETLQRLRRFHMLNGKEVRGWAKRFIGY